ncbi:CHAT domain-containing protein [Lyngbya sp. CCY1209]|uniref:CHAT domain-containing protein n=1 Tax=Lyngbya sp. CCY1209 TaxID=2886103 RepID=UPI002D2019C1|nr:CHAT domain-containing protein [Lyngbya sp. CCY1209]MEB3884910.1 CHAT domain-containing protein [Lyngbya sp. CCY1209]
MNPTCRLRSVPIALFLAGFWVSEILPILPENLSQIRVDFKATTRIANARPIVPEPGGTGTFTTREGNRTDITGGRRSGDGGNLFHSFTRFDVESGAVANFLSDPSIANILARVVGGDASRINGLVRVSGGASNLFLINPAGILFGAGARLDVPGSFTATTAAGIGFDDRWMGVMGENDYAALVGPPDAFAFAADPGQILNAGQLSVNPGESLTLLGGTVINTGRLSAPGGQITVAAVPGENVLRISQTGHLLSLEVRPLSPETGLETQLTPLSLPELLTGGDAGQAGGVTVLADGRVRLTGSDTPISPEPGVVAVSGSLDTSSPAPDSAPRVNIFGDRVGLFGATVNASAPDGGGTVRVGGDYRGSGRVPNATHTAIDANSNIFADATAAGDGGRIVIWSDGDTQFSGQISARGTGDGGFVEISGRVSLRIDGAVNLRGGDGVGTLLLDPLNITIVDGEGGNDGGAFDGQSLAGDNPSEFNLSETTLENLSADADIILEARNNIRIEDLSDNELSLAASGGSVTFTADADGDGQGSFVMNRGDRITTDGGDLTISGIDIATGDIRTRGGNLTLTARDTGQISAGNLSTANPSGPGGNLTLSTAQGSIAAASLETDGQFAGGNIFLDSGRQIRARTLSTRATDAEGAGGDVELGAAREIFLESIDTTGEGGGGNVAIASRGSGILLEEPGEIRTASESGEAGNVSIRTPETLSLLGSVDARGSRGGGDVNLEAAVAIEVGAIATGTQATTASTQFEGGNIILTGDEIDLNGPVSGSGSLLLQTATPTQDINLGRTAGDSSLALDLSLGDLSALQDGFSQIVVGRADGGGTLSLGGDIGFQDSVVLRAPEGQIFGSVSDSEPVATVRGSRGADITFEAANEIRLGNLIVVGGDVNVASRSGPVRVARIEAQADGDRRGNISLAGSEIDLVGGSNSIRGGGTLTLQPADSGQNVSLGGSEGTAGLDLTAADLNALGAEFEQIAIGRPDGNGTLTLSGDVTFRSPVLLRSAGLSGEIVGDGAITGIGNASVALRADGDIRVGSIATGGNTLDLDSARGDIAALDLRSGFNVRLAARGDIETGEIRSEAPPASAPLGEIGLTSREGQIAVNGNIFGEGTVFTLQARDDIRTGDLTAGRPVSLTSDRGAVTTGNIRVTLLDQPYQGINLDAAGTIATGDVTATAADGTGANIAIRSRQGAVRTGNLDASGSGGGGGIAVEAADTATLGAVDTSAADGDGGDVALGAQSDIAVDFIRAEGGGRGGTVAIDTPQFFRATGRFEARNGVEASISTSGGTGGGAIALPDTASSLVVGDPTANGTAAAITDGTLTVRPETAIGDSFEQAATAQIPGNSQIGNDVNADTSSRPAQGETATSVVSGGGNLNPNSNSTAADADQPIAQGNPDETLIDTAGGGLEATDSDAGVPDDLAVRLESATVSDDQIARSPLVASVGQLDLFRGREFVNYFGSDLNKNPVDDRSIRQTLRDIVRLTDYKPAIVYVSLQADQLELRLLLPDAEPIFQSVPVNREALIRVARDFTNQIRTPRDWSDTRYLESGRQLYDRLIAPVRQQLERHDIDTLIFSMDAGLRTLPLAALHDGERFLIERYSLSLIPSLSLTDTSYVNLNGSKVLAMGASEFLDASQEPLPAVPLELALIVGEDLWAGRSFLNEEFTVPNLKSQRTREEYQIIHLATHGEFVAGGADRSYIQFWDRKLGLDELRNLRLNQPPVELLVLSACTTAVGDEKAELGFAGLAVQAGVKSALASLWYVSDAGTLGLMRAFYESLQTSPIKAEALRQAQLAMLRGQIRLEDGRLFYDSSAIAPLPISLPRELATRDNVNLSHPFYWAGFTLIGSPW